MSSPDSGYPHHLAGDDAPAPEPVAARVLDMALRAEAQLREAAGPPLEAAAPWRTATAIDVLFAEANASRPRRSKVSDGRKGNAAHETKGRGSDHNPWLIHGGKGIVRAADITNDPSLNLPLCFERLRGLAHAGRLPQVLNGGYAILNGRITREDWTGWKIYTGDPHVGHGHVSVSLNPAQFDSSAPWDIFPPPNPAQGPPAGKPAPSPAPAPPRGWTGPDLEGTGPMLRGNQGYNGPRVQAWQQWLNRHYGLYSDLAEDGWWGPATTAVNREFGQRSGVREADGLNIGPKLAAAYHRAGLFRSLSAARARAVGHVHRADRR